MKKNSEMTVQRETDTFLRGCAIFCVVLIHFFSSFKTSPYVNGAEHQLLAIALDQISRIAVPLFVVLSGYGLIQRYGATKLQLLEFLQKRVLRLVPLYVIWSAIFWILFWMIPSWRPLQEVKPFFLQLFLGSADYHLYFVPMIFQLYLLFPLLAKIHKKFPWLLLVLTGIFQLVFYLLIMDKESSQPGTSFFQSDQKQYYWFFSWIFYFVLGMSVPKILLWLDQHIVGQLLLLVSVAGAAWWMIVSAHHAISVGIDPLLALRFTRPEVLFYASTATVVAFFWVSKLRLSVPGLSWLGKHSYGIYLSHTLFLRLLFLFV